MFAVTRLGGPAGACVRACERSCPLYVLCMHVQSDFIIVLIATTFIIQLHFIKMKYFNAESGAIITVDDNPYKYRCTPEFISTLSVGPIYVGNITIVN